MYLTTTLQGFLCGKRRISYAQFAMWPHRSGVDVLCIRSTLLAADLSALVVELLISAYSAYGWLPRTGEGVDSIRSGLRVEGPHLCFGVKSFG